MSDLFTPSPNPPVPSTPPSNRPTKFLLIFNTIGESLRYFFVQDLANTWAAVSVMDMRYYHHIYIGDSGPNYLDEEPLFEVPNTTSKADLEKIYETRVKQLTDIIYDDDGQFKYKPLTIEQAQQLIRDGATMIECGFVP